MPKLPPIGPYKGDPSLSPGYDVVKAIPFDPKKDSVLGRLSGMFENLSKQIFKAKEEKERSLSLVKNLIQPVKGTSAAFQWTYGTVDDQLSVYGAFEANYRRAIGEELRSGVGLSPARRRMLEAASRETAGIDLSLITSIGERQRLLQELGENVLKTELMVKRFGFPGLYLPSSNPFRATAKMLASSEEGYQPVIDLLQQATFSVDPFATTEPTATALRIGTSALPSLKELQARVARGGHMTLKDMPSTARLFIADTETTGVADIDIVRSLSVGTGRFKDTSGIRTVEIDREVDLGARFDTAQLSGYVSADPHDLRRVTGLGTSVIEKETRFRTAPKGLSDRIFDLKTETGRAQAKAYYADLLGKLNQDDAYFIAYNGQFDVNKLAASARSLGVEDEIVAKFEDRMANGGLVDVLGIVREKLSNKLAKRIAAAKGTPEQRAIIGLQSLLSDTALQQARVAGEAVKPFALENMLQSTNLLENLAQEAEAGSTQAGELLDLLSSSQASHVDFTDRQVALKVLEYAESDRLDLPDKNVQAALNLSEANIGKIAAARLNVASSRAIVATTNLADPRYLPQVVYENLIGTDAIKNVQIDTPISKIFTGRPEEIKRLRFDPKTGSFRLFTPDPDNPVGKSLVEDLPSGFDPIQFIKAQIDRMRALDMEGLMEIGQPVIHSLGMSPIDIANIHATNEMLMSGTSPLIEAVGSNITGANESALLKGLTATGKVGFLPLNETAGFDPDTIGPIRGFHDAITDSARREYRKILYDAGISSASMDPDLRSIMVGMAEVTSPRMSKNKEFLTRVARGPGISEKHAEGRAEALSGHLGGSEKYLRELGAVTAVTQKNIVATDRIFLLPKKILEKAFTVDDLGMKVGFLSQAAMASRGNAVRLSIARRPNEEVNPTINLIYGGESVPGQKNIRKQLVEARSLYHSTLAVLEETGRSPEAMIKAGLAVTDTEALDVLSAFKPLTDQRRS